MQIKFLKNYKLIIVLQSSIEIIKNAVKMGLKKGVLEGNILQLPAEFILDEKLNLKYSYCGKTSGDILSPKELLKRFN